jgi:hypothetical protein
MKLILLWRFFQPSLVLTMLDVKDIRCDVGHVIRLWCTQSKKYLRYRLQMRIHPAPTPPPLSCFRHLCFTLGVNYQITDADTGQILIPFSNDCLALISSSPLGGEGRSGGGGGLEGRGFLCGRWCNGGGAAVYCIRKKPALQYFWESNHRV